MTPAVPAAIAAEQEAETPIAAIERLSRDIRDASKLLTPQQARWSVSQYYAIQEQRIRTSAQGKKLGEGETPHALTLWLESQFNVFERQIARALDAFSGAHPVGQWARQQKGIGPVLAAGLLAHLDIHQAPTVGHWWAFGGYDPTAVWSKGEKRPWNANLKVIYWKIGESFVKISGYEDGYYGHVYSRRKTYEEAKNLNGDYADQCAASLSIKKYGDDTEALIWYQGRLTREDVLLLRDTPNERRMGLAKKLAGEIGCGVPMLPPARIHERAKRYAVKLFLSHLHDVWYRHEFQKAPPLPYPIAHMGHAHYLPPPGGQS